MARDPLQTRLCEEYGCEYPIIAFAHTRDVTVAVSNAGGIGMLGQSTVSAEEMRTNIRWVKERVGDRPFGVDITIPSSYVEGSREELEQQIPQGHWDFIDRLIEETRSRSRRRRRRGATRGCVGWRRRAPSSRS